MKKQSWFEFHRDQKNTNCYRRNYISNIEHEPKKAGRCKSCLDEIKGENYKTLKDKIGKVKGFCSKCKNHCCSKHGMLFCKDC